MHLLEKWLVLTDRFIADLTVQLVAETHSKAQQV